MKSKRKNICRTLAVAYGIIFYAGAFGGFEVGNYDFSGLLFRLLFHTCVILLLVFFANID